MLQEIQKVRQIPNEPFRRWFNDKNSDLIIWEDDERAICGFQFCFSKGQTEKSLTWKKGKGFQQALVESGESELHKHKTTPFLMVNTNFDFSNIVELFKFRDRELESRISQFVVAKMQDYLKKS
ncbi:MAG: hypothetical protein KJO88_08285 [Gammaproteobacteria bacterium]|nr:hypothetical protein [Gammaproteobacteria bacterium]